MTWEELIKLSEEHRASDEYLIARGRKLLPARAHHIMVREAGGLVILSQGRGRNTDLRGERARAAIAALRAGFAPRAPGRSRNGAIVYWGKDE